MIETYWNEVFGKYKLENGKFEIPGFPEPLMSAHFGVTNIIGPTNASSKNFWICEFPKIKEKFELEEFHIQSLEKANVCEEFWRFQEQHSNETFPFIKKLVPFLLGTDTPHLHFFLKDHQGIYASSLAGISPSASFLFNLYVREDQRGKGTAKKMHMAAISHLHPKPAFYWTKHENFFLGGKCTQYSLI